MSKSNYKPTAARIAEARREGQYVRAKSFSKGEERKNPKAQRRKAKRDLRRYI